MAFLVRRQALSSGYLPYFFARLLFGSDPVKANFLSTIDNLDAALTNPHTGPSGTLVYQSKSLRYSFFFGCSLRRRRQSPDWRRPVGRRQQGFPA